MATPTFLPPNTSPANLHDTNPFTNATMKNGIKGGHGTSQAIAERIQIVDEKKQFKYVVLFTFRYWLRDVY